MMRYVYHGEFGDVELTRKEWQLLRFDQLTRYTRESKMSYGCTGMTGCGDSYDRPNTGATFSTGVGPTGSGDPIADLILREELWALSSLRERGFTKILNEVADSFDEIRETAEAIKKSKLDTTKLQDRIETQLADIRGTVAYYLNEPLPIYRRIWRRIFRK